MVENTDYIGGVGAINLYGEVNISEGDKILIKSDKSWKGSRDIKEPWKKVKSYGRPPKITGGLCYPNFEENIHSNDGDYMAFFNTLVSRVPRWLYWLILLIFKLFHRYDILE